MLTSNATQSAKKPVFRASEASILVSSTELKTDKLSCIIHRRAEEIHTRLRLIQAGLKTNKERLVFGYIVDNTLGRGKVSDQIANSQFRKGKRCRKTGQIIDFGCGLTSLKAIREARKSLLAQGIIFEKAETDLYGRQAANRYGLVFLVELLEAHKPPKRTKARKQYTPLGYYEIPPTIEYPSDILKQRCTTADRSKQTKKHKHFMDSEHVDYLADLIEQRTGDTHSRGAFAQIALTVPEGRIMELLSILKDRTDIKNKGAWFLSVARKYQSRRIIKADDPEPPTHREEREQAIPSSVSYRDILRHKKPELADLLSINRKLSIPATHHKFATGT